MLPQWEQLASRSNRGLRLLDAGELVLLLVAWALVVLATLLGLRADSFQPVRVVDEIHPYAWRHSTIDVVFVLIVTAIAAAIAACARRPIWGVVAATVATAAGTAKRLSLEERPGGLRCTTALVAAIASLCFLVTSALHVARLSRRRARTGLPTLDSERDPMDADDAACAADGDDYDEAAVDATKALAQINRTSGRRRAFAHRQAGTVAPLRAVSGGGGDEGNESGGANGGGANGSDGKAKKRKPKLSGAGVHRLMMLSYPERCLLTWATVALTGSTIATMAMVRPRTALAPRTQLWHRLWSCGWRL